MMLTVTDAEIGYGPVTVVRSLSLEVNAGEAVCLVGPNGAGKSTTLRGVLGLNKLTAGSVAWDGVDITHRRPAARVRAGLAVVPEGRRIFPLLTVRENLEVAARLTGTGSVSARIDEAFDRFPRLAERRHQPGGLLSGGEQQMLAISRALVQQPRVLLIDELSLGLAPVIFEQVGDVVKSLAHDGLGVLLVEQNAALAMRTCSRGYLLSGGRVALSGSVDEMRENTVMRDLYFGGLDEGARR